MKRFLSLLLSCILLYTVVGCDIRQERHEPELSASDVSLEVYEAFSVELLYADEAVVWSSDSANVGLTQDKNLVTVRGLAVGDATVTATYKNITYSFPVTVTLSGARFEKDEVLCTKDSGDIQLSYVKKEDLRTLRFDSSDPYVANVDKNGILTPKTAGQTTISAYSGSTVYDTVLVTVYENDVLLSDSHICLRPSEEKQLSAAENAEWTSSDISVVTVSEGKLRGVAVGSADITVSKNGVSDVCHVTVCDSFGQTIGATDDKLRKIGRGFVSDGKYVFSNTAAGFTVGFFGTSLTAKLEDLTYKTSAHSPLYVIVDGEFTTAEILDISDLNDYTLVSGLDNGYHTVKVLRQLEANTSETVLTSLTCDGVFTDAPEGSSLKIEVYGDSITVGLESVKNSGAEDKYAGSDGVTAYGPTLARLLSADVSVHGQSGIRLLGGMSSLYAAAGCSAVTHFEEDAVWNLTDYSPDIVIIHLGTNDTGIKNLNLDDFKGAYRHLIDTLRDAYGEDTVFLLLEGTMVTTMKQPIQEVAESEQNTYFLSLPAAIKGHPSQSEQRVMAEKIYSFLLENNLV